MVKRCTKKEWSPTALKQLTVSTEEKNLPFRAESKQTRWFTRYK